MPIREVKVNKLFRAFTYGNTGVMYYYKIGNSRSKIIAYNKILKYVRAIHSRKK